MSFKKHTVYLHIEKFISNRWCCSNGRGEGGGGLVEDDKLEIYIFISISFFLESHLSLKFCLFQFKLKLQFY